MLCSSKGSVVTVQRQKRKAETMMAGTRVSVANMVGLLDTQVNRDVGPVEDAGIFISEDLASSLETFPKPPCVCAMVVQVTGQKKRETI